MEELMFILMLLYLLFGLIQVLDGIIRRIAGKNQPREYTKRLDKYLLGVLLYFVILYLTVNANEPAVNSGQFMIIYLFVVPWAFVIYKWRTRAFKSIGQVVEIEQNEKAPEDRNHNGYFV